MIKSFVFRNGSEINERVFYGVPQVGQVFCSLGRVYEVIEVRASIDMLIVQEV